MVGTIEKGVIQMLGIIGTGVLFLGIAYAEHKGWVDKEKVQMILTLGMSVGIMISLFYFFHLLSISFL
jgi:hypothetical protein